MSEDDRNSKPKYLDAKQVVYLPAWARYSIMIVLGLLAMIAAVSGFVFLFYPELRDQVSPALSVAQTAAGGFAVVLFVLFAERQLSTAKLHSKTDEFLEKHLVEALSRIELPQVRKGVTVKVNVLKREDTVHGGRKDIYGANYDIHLENFRMQMWAGINVKRLSTIYFVKLTSEMNVEQLKDIFRFTLGGAEKVGYHTNVEFAEIDGERIASIWSTALAENAILGNPAEQLFWVQDIAMMTQSLARTALRNSLTLVTHAEPGPL